MNLARLLSKWLFVALMAGLAGGCFAIGPNGPSKVSRAERYVPGVPEYDSFFAELHELQQEMGRAPAESKEVQADLAERIDLDQDASLELISERLKKRAEQLADHGIALKVEFFGLDGKDEGDASVSATGEPKGQDARFVRHVEHGAKRAAQVILKMRQAKQRARKLALQVPDLETRVETAMHLRGPARTSEAKRNLYDARILLPLIVDRSESITENERDLIHAIETATKLPETDAYKDDHEVAAEPRKAEPAQRSNPAKKPEKKPNTPAALPESAKSSQRRTTFADFTP